MDMTSILGDYQYHHVCVVTSDLERMKKNYAALLGVPVPETTVSNDYANMHTWFKGELAPKSGLSQTAVVAGNGGMIELIMPDDGPSAWNDHLKAYGDGLHHFAFVVKDLPGVLKRCEENGMPKVQTGDFPGGRYAYVDGRKFVGAFLELMEID